MNEILSKTEAYISEMMAEKITAAHTFHNIDHTREVVDSAREIAEQSGLDEHDLEIVLIAAWFHDIGHIDKDTGHEEKSIEIAREFLGRHNYPAQKIEAVASCIKATGKDVKPESSLQMVLCDADLAHIGRKGSFKKGQLLRQELANVHDKKFSDEEWIKVDISFYSQVEFYTDYAKEVFDPVRLKNILKLQEKTQRLLLPKTEKKKKTPKNQPKLKDENKRSPGRGVETVFRTTSRNHISLSSIADNKANTLISINAIILSIIISFLGDQLQVNQHLVLPTVLLLFTCVATIIMAVLSTKPKVTEGRVTRKTIEQGKGNLLFFGNFHQMSLEDFEWGMKHLMEDNEYLYHNLVQDIYYLGLVLERKYRFLRIAFTVFMFGLIISVTSYIFAFIWPEFFQGFIQ